MEQNAKLALKSFLLTSPQLTLSGDQERYQPFEGTEFVPAARYWMWLSLAARV